MRLIVKRSDGRTKEFRFGEGHVSLGRDKNSNQVFLPDKAVSKRHAVISASEDSKWMVEDMGSANKTYLNDQVISKAEIKTGDVLRITKFTIEINLEEDGQADQAHSKEQMTDTSDMTNISDMTDTSDMTNISDMTNAPDMTDTLDTQVTPATLSEDDSHADEADSKDQVTDASDVTNTSDIQVALAIPSHETVVRKPDAAHAPAMRLAARRLSDFSRATEAICATNGLDELLTTLLDIMVKQFSAFHCWCALREQPNGPMTYHAGKRRDGRAVTLSDLKLNQKISQVAERGQSMVLPRVSAQVEEKERIRSALIVSIMRVNGCYGILYVDNAMMHDHYSLSDLDYLMLLAMHTAAVLRKFLDL